jgi:flavin reductase (DIM6/NTAB) family NADH-FMN oxidoreductase RutF
MSDPKSPAPPSALARALGRIPSGLYILTTQEDGRALGFVASLVMQTGFSPPTVCVAVGKDRPHLAAIRHSGRFGLSILDAASNGLMAPFFKKLPEGASPFAGLATTRTSAGSIVFTEALAWLDCRLLSTHDTPDHTIVFAEVTDGLLQREADPKVHLRKNGLSY